MARWQQWPVIDGAYKDDALPWSAQDTCNWLPTPAEQAGARSGVILRTPPGLIEFCDLGTDAPIRGSHDVEGLLLVVSDNTLFRVSSTGVATSIGTIPGVGRVSMDHTPRGAGFHVGIANGQSGYIYDTGTDTLTQITDEGFPGATIFQFIDGYLAFLEPFGKFWGHSELNDGLNYNTLDRYTAESAPDGIKSLIVSHREVFTPGDRSGEFFRNTGAATGTFQRADGYEMERGIASPYAITRLDNSVYWLGEDGIVYRLENGHNPVRISNGAIEQALANSNIANAFAFAWDDRGHNVFYLTVPDGHTWGYDAWTGKWHRRQSYGLNRWRLATLTKWNGQWIGGDYTNGKLYTLSWAEDAVHENGDPLVSERTFPAAHDVGNDLIVNGIRLLFDTGKGGPSAPSITGDVPDGSVGSAISGTYTVTGGIPPYGGIAVLSGTFPPGLTLDPDGSYSGTYTTVGSYSWTVGGVDAFGSPFSVADSATICEQIVGVQTDALTLTSDVRVAHIEPSGTDVLAYSAGNYGISVAGTYSFGVLDDALGTVSSGTATVQAGSPGDGRLWMLSRNVNGWLNSSDDNFGYCELWLDGVYQARVKPTSGDVDTWFSTTHTSRDNGFGEMSWYDSSHLYLGVRYRGGTNHRKIYKFALAASGSTALAAAISPLLTPTAAGFFLSHMGRDGVLRVIDLEGLRLKTLSLSDLSVTADVALTVTLTDARAFAIDADKLIIYRRNNGTGVQTLDVWRMPAQTLISTQTITGTAQDYNNRIVCGSGSVFIQSGATIKRVAYTQVCTP